MDQSSELEIKTSADQGESSSGQPVDDELDGLPVFGTDEDDWEIDSSFAQKALEQMEKNSDDKNESQDRVPTSGADAENISSINGSSEMDEERPKVSEDTPVTPLSDTIIDIQDVQSELRIESSRSDANPELPSECAGRETSYSPVISIKDEPIDEEYDKALMPESDMSRVKQELDSSENNENEACSASDELRISSVFSVSGNSSDAVSASMAPSHASSFSVMSQNAATLRGTTILLPAQSQTPLQLRLQPKTQMHPQIHTRSRMQPSVMPQTHLQPPPQPPQIHAPPPTVRICCSGCSKVLQKGQTAFQRKGSNQLFCSTVCLTSFSLPSVQFTPIVAPKKTCHLCLKVIVNLKDLITIPVGSMNTLKEFCSQACLSIYKNRYEDATPDLYTQCGVCKLVKEIQHEVTHLGAVHKLCSDECFARFRSSRNLYMSYCENCGNCTASGNYHLVQIEDSIKKFCCTECISNYKQKSGKRLHCPYCQDIKDIEQMMEGTNIQGVTEFFCSQRCVALSQASPSLTGKYLKCTSFPCTTCKKLAVPQYHLAISDGSIRNFCSLDCVGKFQEKLNASVPHNQMNGNSQGPPPQSSAPPRPTTDHLQPTQTSSSVPGPNHNPPPPFVPPSIQNPVPTYVPAPAVVNSQDAQQQWPIKPPSSSDTVQLTCKQCQNQFSSKPEVFQFKGHAGLFCSRACCDTYKRESSVKALCEYCKIEKVVKDIITYEKQPRSFCCEGCKLLFKHDLAKRHGGQCRVCAYCQNMTHKTIQNFFGGKLEEFCTEECMSLYTVLFYEMAKCHGCKNQGSLKESLVWDGTTRHFCNLSCLLQFCSKCITPHQPASNGAVSNTTTVQAPLSLSKDMPVIGGVVSLASTLPGNTALTGALPTSNASSKNIGEASTQTDAAVSAIPYRRTLKNKALMCRPITEEQGVQCQPEPPIPPNLCQTVIDENGEKVKLVPVPVPIPMPVYIPVPMHLYTQYTPFPLGLPLPVPVPMVIPGSQDSPEQKDTECSLPAQSSVEDDDVDKGKDKPASHDQGSTYSGDLETEARSTPFSLADTEDPGVKVKPPVPSTELEPVAARATSLSSEQPDLENDFPRSSADPGSAKENRLVLTLKRRKRGRDSHPPRKRGRKRSGTDTPGGVWLSSSSTKLNQMYGVEAWASWVRMKAGQSEQEQQSQGSMTMKEDLLQCTSVDLSYGLCRFIKEVRRPNGEPYDPDSIYYLCLGIQQRLLENERLENIFTDSLYSQFISDITTLLKDWGNMLPPGGYVHSRVEEEYLWECKQLGALSPIVLLNTLLFFGAKLLNLKTVEEHRRLAFANVSHCSKTTKNGMTAYLRFRLPGKEEEKDKKAPAGKRRREEEKMEEEILEMPENVENPLRCPVRLYEFYLSKCSDSVKQRPDLFYLQPEASCHPSSPVWYSAQPLDRIMMESMLTRILAIRDIHLDSKHQQKDLDSSDEESS
ncbi:zinc finger MYM-type protein 4-like isoform X1 [Carassius carassius]|uniref:zinc finger MYM-type protein 4-like isoform X1 n=1 Tax=Carassius carassius TaxID=217509 RepID=UPI002868F0D9|nr:zinc finger MYM-type protein 4-like isoform X1 [Carassius carassius]XP_059374637.1 zinc finger MYM-type protein 4-like isoform X1 [Carassius carassius]XP_059374638.1 zinc finger MYM-type protein 4-like isoform X1 [Carassius carassius]